MASLSLNLLPFSCWALSLRMSAENRRNLKDKALKNHIHRWDLRWEKETERQRRFPRNGSREEAQKNLMVFEFPTGSLDQLPVFLVVAEHRLSSLFVCLSAGKTKLAEWMNLFLSTANTYIHVCLSFTYTYIHMYTVYYLLTYKLHTYNIALLRSTPFSLYTYIHTYMYMYLETNVL